MTNFLARSIIFSLISILIVLIIVADALVVGVLLLWSFVGGLAMLFR